MHLQGVIFACNCIDGINHVTASVLTMYYSCFSLYGLYLPSYNFSYFPLQTYKHINLWQQSLIFFWYDCTFIKININMWSSLSGSESVQVFFIVCLYVYCRWRSCHQEGRVGITLTSLTLPHFCACPKPGPGFPTSYVEVFIVFS